MCSKSPFSSILSKYSHDEYFNISGISICVCVMYSDVKGRSPEIGIQEIWEKIGQQIKILDIDEL